MDESPAVWKAGIVSDSATLGAMNNKNNELEGALANPPKCPNCGNVAMTPERVEEFVHMDGGIIQWLCGRCDFRLLTSFG